MNVLPRLRDLLPGGESAETRLVAAAQRGSREAYDALLRAYERPLRGFLLHRVGDRAADDVLQETWLAGWIALPRYTRRSRFKTWLFAIACHKCTDHFRASRHSALEMPLEAADQAAVSWRDEHAETELRHTVRTLLSRLPDEQREVLEIYYYAELTLAEVAAVLGRNLSTVKSQFYRAHAQVAQELDPEDLAAAKLQTHGKA